MKMTLKVADKEITLDIHEVDGKQLFKAQDLLKGYGMDNKQTANTLSNWKIQMESKLLEFQVVSKMGKNGGTYLTKREILKLAGYVDYDFEDAVYEAFEELVEGNSVNAQRIAEERVQIVREAILINKPRHRIRQSLSSYADISEGVEFWINGMKNFPKATYNDRIRTLDSLRKAVDESYDSIKRDPSGTALHECALRKIAEYERYLARRDNSLRQSGYLKHK